MLMCSLLSRCPCFGIFWLPLQLSLSSHSSLSESHSLSLFVTVVQCRCQCQFHCYRVIVIHCRHQWGSIYWSSWMPPFFYMKYWTTVCKEFQSLIVSNSLHSNTAYRTRALLQSRYHDMIWSTMTHDLRPFNGCRSEPIFPHTAILAMESAPVRDKLGRVSSNWSRQRNAAISAGRNAESALAGIDIIERGPKGVLAASVTFSIFSFLVA